MNKQWIIDLAKAHGFVETSVNVQGFLVLAGVGDIHVTPTHVLYSFARTGVFVRMRLFKFRKSNLQKLEEEILRSLVLSAF